MPKSLTVKNFYKGLIDNIEDYSIPHGAYSRVQNWVTKGDKAELRRGLKMIGSADAGAGKSRIYVAENKSTQVKFRARGKKLEYYNETTELWIEIGTDVLVESGEDVSFAQYHGLAGDQVWAGNPYVLLKIMIANPGDYADMYNSTINYKGYIGIADNRMDLWGRLEDNSGLYQSHVDEQNFIDIAAENIGTGNAVDKTFAATLGFKSGGAKRTCFAIVVTDGVEIFTDNFDGTLTGDKGGTGTINYMTGVISVTFKTAPAGSQAITCDYSYEDSTDGGIADFRYSATRVAGEGDVFRQDEGGELMNVLNFKNIKYCFHRHSIWSLELTADDTNAINQVFRKNAGTEFWRIPVPTGDGIYYIDTSDDKDPKVRLLTFDTNTAEVMPIPISDNIDLTDYRFDEACGFQFGDMVIFIIRHKDHSYNDTQIIYYRAGINKGAWDKINYNAENFAIYDGTLICGTSLNNNVYELFSGLDEDESEIPNFVEFNLTDLDLEYLKKLKQFIVIGEIGPDQKIKVSMAFDNGAFVEVGGSDVANVHTYAIQGDGSYVDKGQKVSVGAMVLGKKEVGGGGNQGDIPAYHYMKRIKLFQDRFEKVKVRLEAVELGYASVSEFRYFDIRIKAQKIPSKYR
jgi:hypothetical protein